MRSPHFLLVPALLVSVSTATSQTQKVVPAANTTVEGSGFSNYPFGYTAGRSQQIWTRAAITSSVALIRGISYRANAPRVKALAARTYSGVTIAVGSTTHTPSSMTAPFANNVTFPLTTVVSGTYNLPAQSTATSGPSPFNIHFAWTTPYVFSSGNLILDATFPGSVARSEYIVDAEVTRRSPGAASPFGSNGTFSSGDTPKMTADVGRLRPGGTVDLQCGPFRTPHTGTLLIGISDSTWNGATLPLNLGLIGAAANNLYVSPDLTTPFDTQLTPAGIYSTLQASIPGTPQHAGLQFYTQAYYVDGPANALGLVFTHGLSLRLAPTMGRITNQIGHFLVSSPTGNHWHGIHAGGPVTQFHGVF